MNLLLFEIGGVDFFVIGGSTHHPTVSESPGQGTLGMLKHKVRAAYETLRHKFDYQENVCSSLRHATSLKIVHPESIDPEDVEKRVASFLSARSRKHKRWMIIDGVLALFGSLLTPIPGPNIFFLYPAVRSLSHYLALRGVRKAQRLKMFTFEAESVIDRVQQNIENLDKAEGQIRELEKRFDVRSLKRLLST